MGNLIAWVRPSDMYRFWEVPRLVKTPLTVILSIALIWKIIGWPCLMGVLTILVGQGFNAIIVRYLLRLERRRRAITDTKLQRTTSLVEAIRHLRWYGWQNAWLSGILEARQRELNMRVSTGLLNNLIGFINMISSGNLSL